MESPSTTAAKNKQSPAAGADHVSHPHGVGPEPPLREPTSSGADVDSSTAAAAAALLPQLTQSLVLLADKVEALGATLREVHADMAVLKAQYGSLAAAAQGCATYGVQMTVTFTPQPLPQQPHHPVGAPSPLPPPGHRYHVAPAPATPGHVTPHVMSPSPAPLRKFVDNVATATARAGPPPQPFGAAQTTAAVAPRGLHAKAERHHPRKRTSSTGSADHRLPAGNDGRPAKKPRRDKNKMFVFLDHINNSRVVDDGEGDAGDVDDEEDNRSGRREGELEIVAGSSDEEGEAVEEAVAETSSEGEEEEEDREENESDDEEDGESQATSSSTTAAILADIGEPPHREPIRWIGVDVPVEGKPLNHRLMPEKITKSDQLHVFWQRMKQNIAVEVHTDRLRRVCR